MDDKIGHDWRNQESYDAADGSVTDWSGKRLLPVPVFRRDFVVSAALVLVDRHHAVQPGELPRGVLEVDRAPVAHPPLGFIFPAPCPFQVATSPSLVVTNPCPSP